MKRCINILVKKYKMAVGTFLGAYAVMDITKVLVPKKKKKKKKKK